jgi:hypothetical protein
MFSIKCFTKIIIKRSNLPYLFISYLFIKRYLNLSFLFKSIFKFIIKRDILILYIY